MDMSNEEKQKDSLNHRYHNEKNQIKKLYASSRQKIYSFIFGKIEKLSCHKFASNVIEKSLKEGQYDQIISIVNEILMN
jgi:hypothetical protein